MNSLAATISYLRPGAEWSLTGDTLAGLEWHGPGDSPTQDEIDAAMPDAILDREWRAVRAVRDRLLAGSDWTQMPDAPLTAAEKQAWAAYRQTLRDIPQDFASPDDVVWPDAP